MKQQIRFQCSIHCNQCQLDLDKNQQCIKCKIGYFLDKNDCVQCSINCFECIEQANCVSCKFPQQKNNKDQLCKFGYYADEINGTFLNKYGDQIKVKEEECDDGNAIKGYRCDNECKLENKYIFINGLSIIPNYPKPLLQSVLCLLYYLIVQIVLFCYYQCAKGQKLVFI
ncbi:unnamed protein product [Paramecium octaurelia]|uniref:Transmembrane protein n=1 Tax=Paramecium octaurelia TaxID=43137 RepID=A0A8S1XV76_PAROT|nr:unnamed protein product [Paramecium octaurelia]